VDFENRSSPRDNVLDGSGVRSVCRYCSRQ